MRYDLLVLSIFEMAPPHESSWTPPTSHSLSGLTFHFVGTWATMSIKHAQHLCRANGGCVPLQQRLLWSEQPSDRCWGA